MTELVDDIASQPQSPATVHSGAEDGSGGPRSLVGGGPHGLESSEDVVKTEAAASDGSAPSGFVEARLFHDHQEPRVVELSELPQLVLDDPNFVWVDLSDYAEADLTGIATSLDLHRIAVRSALSQWQRPRLDVFGDQFFVSVTVPRLKSNAHEVLASQLDLFVGPNFLLSAHKSPLPFTDRVRARTDHNPELFELDSAYMLYVILDELIAYCETLGERIQGDVEEMEERALRDTSDAFLADLLHFKRYAFALSQLANQHRNVFEAFLRPDFSFVSGQELQVYFRDLRDRFSRLIDTLSGAREAVNGAFDIYVSHVAHRTNQVIKILTMVSVLLLPAMVILELFSTNILGVPIYKPVDYWLAITAIVLISVVTLLTFRRMKWI